MDHELIALPSLLVPSDRRRRPDTFPTIHLLFKRLGENATMRTRNGEDRSAPKADAQPALDMANKAEVFRSLFKANCLARARALNKAENAIPGGFNRHFK